MLLFRKNKRLYTYIESLSLNWYIVILIFSNFYQLETISMKSPMFLRLRLPSTLIAHLTYRFTIFSSKSCCLNYHERLPLDLDEIFKTDN